MEIIYIAYKKISKMTFLDPSKVSKIVHISESPQKVLP